MACTSACVVRIGSSFRALDDCVGDGAGFALFAQYADDPRELIGLGAVDDIGGRDPGLLHPHVQRAFLGEGEAALSFIELHRGHADIEGRPIDHGDAEARSEVLHIA